MADRLISRLTDWLIGRPTAWLFDCLMYARVAGQLASHYKFVELFVYFTTETQSSKLKLDYSKTVLFHVPWPCLLFCLWPRFCHQIAKRWKKWMIDRQAKANVELCFLSRFFILSGSCYPTAPGRASDSSEWKFLERRKRETEEVLRMY